MEFLKRLSAYLQLVKFRYHITFSLVVVGFLVSYEGSWLIAVGKLLLIYISFNCLLYSGIYTLNDIADIEKDKKHFKKKDRPLPSGRVSITAAYIFSASTILLGLWVGYAVFGFLAAGFYVAFWAINFLYTFFFKKIAYVEILGNSLTYPLRFMMGSLFAAGVVVWPLVAAVFFLAFSMATARRTIELVHDGVISRPVLRHYPLGVLTFLQIISLLGVVMMFSNNYPHYWWLYLLASIPCFIFLFAAFPWGNRWFGWLYRWAFLS